MEYLGVIVVATIGITFILIRNIYARFILSFLHELPTIRRHQTTIRRVLQVISVAFGLAFLGYAVAMVLV